MKQRNICGYVQVLLPKPGFDIVCEICYNVISTKTASSEDGDIEDFWCEVCMDFRGGKYDLRTQQNSTSV
jgi:hypothetical protein